MGRPEVPVLLTLTGYLYSKGVRIKNRSFRLKSGYGIKNAVMGFSWSFSIAYSLKTFNPVILIFYFLKLFMNSTIFDLKDKDKDNIKTIPKLLDENIKILLTALNITAHFIAFLKFGLNTILITSFVLSQVAVLNKKEKNSRSIIASEPSISVFLYLFLWNFLLHN
ncbi:prenyltransferase [archaeon BMS3Bbin15]|nr:prenyltransferase [archaeon BMS3Bbin15]